jgi:MFS family permease
VRDEPAWIRGKITGIFTGGIDAGVLGGSILLGFVGEWAGFQSLFLLAGLALFSGLGVFRLHDSSIVNAETRRVQRLGL